MRTLLFLLLLISSLNSSLNAVPISALNTDCQSGKMPSCMTLGNFFSDTASGLKDLALAKSYYLRACDLGHHFACLQASVRMASFDADGVAKGCGLGYGPACAKLAEYLDDMNSDRNIILYVYNQALRFNEQGCAKDDAISCKSLAALRSEGPLKDTDKALDAHQRGCELKDASSCFALVGIYKQSGLSNKAQQSLDTACELGLDEACASNFAKKDRE